MTRTVTTTETTLQTKHDSQPHPFVKHKITKNRVRPLDPRRDTEGEKVKYRVVLTKYLTT